MTHQGRFQSGPFVGAKIHRRADARESHLWFNAVKSVERPKHQAQEETVIMSTLIGRLAPIARLLGYALVFLVPPLVVGGVAAARTWSKMGYNQPPAFAERSALPAHDPTRRTAVIIMSNIATELTDFLGPYEVLTTSGAFNVYGVAPEAKLVNLGQGLDVMPHFSFEEYNRVVGANPDLIVIPFMSNINTPENGPTTQWIRDHFGPTTTLLSICGGALNLAETGLLDGRPATTYWDLFPTYTGKYPKVQWVKGQRFVDSGNIVTSAGITNGIPTTLYVLRKLVGEAVAQETGRKLGYPFMQFLDNPTFQLGRDPLEWMFLNTAYGVKRANMGVVLFDGVGEIDLTAIMDTYTRSGTTVTYTVAPTRRLVRSKHGLYFVPRYDFTTAPAFSRIVVPGGPSDLKDRQVEQWAAGRQGHSLEYLYTDTAPRPFAFDATIMAMAQHDGPIFATTVAARQLEYPADHLPLAPGGWPLSLLLLPLALGVVSVAVVRWGGRTFKARLHLAPAPTYEVRPPESVTM